MLSALAVGWQRRTRFFLARAALAVASLGFGLTALGFATSALYAAWRAQYGAVYASLDVAAIYLVVAVLLSLGRILVRSGPTTRNSPDQYDGAASAPFAAPDGAQGAALMAGAALAKQLTPLQLVLLGAMSGFFAGRKM